MPKPAGNSRRELPAGEPVDPDSELLTLPHPLRPTLLALVAVGAVPGTLVRYFVGRAVPTQPGQFPLSTFTVNIAGAFILGALLAALARPGPERLRRRQLRLLLGTGFCGALTTYSTLAVDSDQLFRHHAAALAIGYAAASVAVGLLACGLGVAVASQWRKH